MIDKDTYKRELVRMWDSLRDDEYKGIESCSGVNDCGGCPLNNIKCGESSKAFEMIEAVEKWSKEHQPKKFKVSQLEYDILKIYIDLESYGTFNGYAILSEILKKGYFAGATSKTNIRDYFNNCEVKKDV